MSKAKSTTKEKKHKGYKIVLVEDEKTIAEMYITKFSQEKKINITHVENGGNAISVIREELPDMVLLDIILPQEDGFSILQKIRDDKKIKKTPVIMLTNLGQEEDKEKAKKMGALDYLVKANMTPTDVFKKVKEILKLK
jgi:DNA-binding response OmpR family regulator